MKGSAKESVREQMSMRVWELALQGDIVAAACMRACVHDIINQNSLERAS